METREEVLNPILKAFEMVLTVKTQDRRVKDNIHGFTVLLRVPPSWRHTIGLWDSYLDLSQPIRPIRDLSARQRSMLPGYTGLAGACDTLDLWSTPLKVVGKGRIEGARL